MNPIRRFFLFAVLIVTRTALGQTAHSAASAPQPQQSQRVPQPQRVDALGPGVLKYLRVRTPKVVLEHVQIIDGTGAPPSPDQNIYIEGGKISGISAGADQPPSESTTAIDLRGYSVMPGIVGMHNHLFYFARPNLGPDGSYESPALFLEMSFSA